MTPIIDGYKEKPDSGSTAFTTARKKPKSTINISRKGSIVKERCKQLTQMVVDLSGGIISDEDLTYLIQIYIGGDKETLRAYKGYGGHIRMGQYGDNTIVGLSRKGYLEEFGFLRKISRNRWAVVQTLLSSSAYYETSTSETENIEKVSISQLQPESAAKEPTPAQGTASSREREEEEATEKDRNFTPKISPILPNFIESSVLKTDVTKKTGNSKVN